MIVLTGMNETIKFIDVAFLQLAIKKSMTLNPRHFASIIIKAMQYLQMEKKPNLVYKFSEMVTLQKFGNPAEPVIQLGRMPFGLIEYVIQFFVTPHVKQVIVLYVTVTHCIYNVVPKKIHTLPIEKIKNTILLSENPTEF